MIIIREETLENKDIFFEANHAQNLFKEYVVNAKEFNEELWQFCKKKHTLPMDKYTFHPIYKRTIDLSVYKIQDFTFFWSEIQPNCFYEYTQYEFEMSSVIDWFKQIHTIWGIRFLRGNEDCRLDYFKNIDFSEDLEEILESKTILPLIPINDTIKEILGCILEPEYQLNDLIKNFRNEIDVLSIYNILEECSSYNKKTYKENFEWIFETTVDRVKELKSKDIVERYKKYLASIFVNFKKEAKKILRYDLSPNPFWQFIENDFLNPSPKTDIQIIGFKTTLKPKQIESLYNETKGKYIAENTNKNNFYAVLTGKKCFPLTWIKKGKGSPAHKTSLREFEKVVFNSKEPQKTIDLYFRDINKDKIKLAKPKKDLNAEYWSGCFKEMI